MRAAETELDEAAGGRREEREGAAWPARPRRETAAAGRSRRGGRRAARRSAPGDGEPQPTRRHNRTGRASCSRACRLTPSPALDRRAASGAAARRRSGSPMPDAPPASNARAQRRMTPRPDRLLTPPSRARQRSRLGERDPPQHRSGPIPAIASSPLRSRRSRCPTNKSDHGKTRGLALEQRRCSCPIAVTRRARSGPRTTAPSQAEQSRDLPPVGRSFWAEAVTPR